MAHITGGGFYENIPRMFSKALTAVIYKDSFKVPDIFRRLMDLGVDEDHMFNTFNMGIGFVLCVNEADKDDVIKALESLGQKAYHIGHIEAGGGGVCLR
jgi:phosphoribosylformylglycinamidine cyclo-ligase